MALCWEEWEFKIKIKLAGSVNKGNRKGAKEKMGVKLERNEVDKAIRPPVAVPKHMNAGSLKSAYSRTERKWITENKKQGKTISSER